MKEELGFSSTWEYVREKDCILFIASLPDRDIDCLISSEAIQYCFNGGSNEGKPNAFEANREAINKIAEDKIRLGAFHGENEILIAQTDCEAHNFKSVL